MIYLDGESDLIGLLKEEMQSRNLSVRQATLIIGTSHPTLSRALTGDKISNEFAMQLSQFLHIPQD
jgi:plasmid maintenance system antidote protein VapI